MRSKADEKCSLDLRSEIGTEAFKRFTVGHRVAVKSARRMDFSRNGCRSGGRFQGGPLQFVFAQIEVATF